MLDINDSIGRRVQDLRLRHALSQADLAQRAGLGRSTVMRIEHGGPMHPSTVRQLARALGVRVTQLTSGE